MDGNTGDDSAESINEAQFTPLPTGFIRQQTTAPGMSLSWWREARKQIPLQGRRKVRGLYALEFSREMGGSLLSCDVGKRKSGGASGAGASDDYGDENSQAYRGSGARNLPWYSVTDLSDLCCRRGEMLKVQKPVIGKTVFFVGGRACILPPAVL